MARLPRRAAFVLLLVALAAVLLAAVGCGGESASSTTSSSVVVGPAVTQPVQSVQTLVGTKIYGTTETPTEIKDSLEQHRPLAVLFYVPGGADDQAVREALSGLRSKYPDISFAMYDYKDAAAYGDLATLLKVDYPPQTVFIDSTGTVAQVLTGYVDQGVLNQSLTNIKQG